MTETVAIIVASVIGACSTCTIGVCQYYNRTAAPVEQTVFIQENNEIGQEIERSHHSIEEMVEDIFVHHMEQRNSDLSDTEIDVNIRIHTITSPHGKEIDNK